MGKINIILLMVFATSANAEVFKCQLADKTVYQSKPCHPNVIKQQLLDIQPTPADQVNEAEQRLNAWKKALADREAAEQQAKKERQDALNKEAEINALKRSAKAQEALAKANRKPIIINPRPVYARPLPRFIRDKPDRGHRRHSNDDAPMADRNPRTPVNKEPSGWITPTH